MEFDKLIKEYLTTLNEAPISGDAEEIAKEISSKAKEAPMTGHWKLLKRQQNIENVSLEILKLVLPTKKNPQDKDNTYNPEIDTTEDLKKEINKAIDKVINKGGWAAKFLTDRINTITVKRVVFELVNQAITSKKNVTQKEVKQALNKALEEKPAAASGEPETVYYRAADLDSEDPVLTKAFNKLPAEGNIKWSEIVAKVGDEAANSLKKAGAIIEVVGGEEEAEDEEKEIPALEFDDEDDFDTSSEFDRLINPYFSTTKSDYYRD